MQRLEFFCGDHKTADAKPVAKCEIPPEMFRDKVPLCGTEIEIVPNATIVSGRRKYKEVEPVDGWRRYAWICEAESTSVQTTELC